MNCYKMDAICKDQWKYSMKENLFRLHENKAHIYIYIYIYINFVCQVLMSKYIYKKLRHLFTKYFFFFLFTKKLYFRFFQTFKNSIK